MRGRLLSFDLDREFTNQGFQKLRESHDIAHRTNGNGEPNAIAVLDRAAHAIRQDISARANENRGTARTQAIKGAIVAYNRSIQGTMRDTPADIEDNEVLQDLQASDNAERFAHNSKLA